MSLRTFFILPLILILILIGCEGNKVKNADKLFSSGNYQEAIDAYTKVIDESPRNLGAFYNRGRAYEELDNFEKAESDFQVVLELDEKNVNACLSLAKLYYRNKQYGKALIYAQNALKFNHNSADGYFLSARAQHQLGYVDAAMESYTMAIKSNVEYGEAYLYRGALKVHLKQTKSACEDFKKAENLEVQEAPAIRKNYCN